MTSIRLPDKIEKELDQISSEQHISKSAIIKKAITDYVDAYFASKSPYNLGSDLFGKFGNEQTDDSSTYKQQLKGRIDAKRSH